MDPISLLTLLLAPALALGRWWSGLHPRTLRVDGVPWSYLEGGVAGAPTVVLLHGFGADKDNWLLLARHLTRSYHVICPDLPGFGGNTRSLQLDYGTTAQAERLHSFLAALGVERLHLAGNSMGGFIALRYALRYPESLASLILLNAAGVPGTRRSALELGLERGENVLVVETMEDLDRLLAIAAHKPTPLPWPYRQLLFLEAKRDAALRRQIFSTIAGEVAQAPLNPQLPEIQTPTLILWGREDRLIDVSCAESFAAGLPQSRCVIFEETGHVPMLERPRECADALLQHLQTCA